ncbi:ABC-F family ATP-binding cassette domain-containing protein [Deinococcus hopiensis]|uniref:ATPase components of ABC transporters with duplicated ATPase domains n=1 Tax=Deinococcus hopiensis KR-140 TaxID=695939 RepID=A0A1W1VUD2_9DEIO|nr:ABC-F family ATP-binding cassette domain-containing protein [Deinococcus hopiensis]SMB96968.1 ATPase components of ABC transporters with duplicated ATPase domains [Deinococcus hopiensis KR-140]
MLQLKNVSFGHADDLVLSDVTLDLNRGERLGLVGANGSGKTTLMRLMAGVLTPDQGHITGTARVAYLAQHAALRGTTVLDVLTPAALRDARAALDGATAHLERGSEADLLAFADAEEAYRQADGYGFEGRALAVLDGLSLQGDAAVDALSGGQMRRVMLARLLLTPADLYLLDEPTNHLDVDGAAWLEGWIQASPAAFMLASHDRAFLEAVTHRVAELERRTLSVYPGAYSAAMAIKAELRAAQQRDHAAYRRKRSALEEERLRRQSKARSANQYNHKRARDPDKLLAKGKAQNAQNVNASHAVMLERAAARLDASAPPKPYEDRQLIRLALADAPPGPVDVLQIRGLGVQRNRCTILRSIDLQVRRGDRIALIGANGSGKSTLLAALTSDAPCAGFRRTGEVRWGQNLTQYWAGQQGEELGGLITIEDALLGANPKLTPHQVHEVAAQLGVPGGPGGLVAHLSGGQRTRLTLARLSVTRAQVLILDEPTNHLDLPAIEALETLLLTFPGTLLLASHDRALVERVATRRWLVRDQAVTEA